MAACHSSDEEAIDPVSFAPEIAASRWFRHAEAELAKEI
jgi:hypothetical protein